VSDLFPIPVQLFQMTGPPAFTVLDAHGNEVGAGGAVEGASDAMVYAPAESLQELRTHLLRSLPRAAGNQLVAAPLRAWLLYTSLTFEVEALVADLPTPRNGRGLAEVTRALGREGASWASSGKAPSYRHRRLVERAFSPAAHAVNSALYATTIAAADGMDDYEALQGVALAAVFADLALQEPLERSRIDRATIIMRRCGVPSVGGIAGVLARYAHWDGSGTPRLGGHAIPLEGRCAAIACDYDLLAEGGPEGESRSPYEALSEMAGHTGWYDPALLRLFVQLVAKIVVAPEEAPTRASA
jgi:HD-GYP domain-containing protein (c-di-GMP phosphodiesterase class II)